MFINVMSKERDLPPVQLTLLKFGIEVVLMEQFTHLLEMFLVFFGSLREYWYVIQKYYYAII